MTAKAHSGIRRGGGGSGGNGNGRVQPIDITPFRNWTLHQVEGRLRGLDHEEMFIIDASGKIVAAYKGDADNLQFPLHLLKIQGGIMTHNHPRGIENFGGTFSPADVRSMLKSNWSEIRAVASGQGEGVYILRRGTKPKVKPFLRRTIFKERQLMNKVNRTRIEALIQAKEAGMSDAVSEHIAAQKALGKAHIYYKRVAKKYGFEYITWKKQYKSGH